MSANMNDLTEITYELRQNVLDIVMSGKGGHIGGDMSVLDILTVLYFRVMNVSPDKKDDPGRDRFIMSKGHSVEALYAVLAAKGFFSLQEVLDRFSRFGSPYIGHPNHHLPGIEMNSGSLGHGLPVSVGMALAGKMDQASYRVYTVMGDGELAEGSVWEAAMAAGNYKLDNLCATIDRNHLQISGDTEEVMKQNSLKERFEAFGWNVIEAANGNDTEELFYAYTQAEKAKGKPSLVIASTVKGFGSSIMENKLQWHHRVPTEEEYIQISRDLKERKERIRHE
jgi:transketolase